MHVFIHAGLESTENQHIDILEMGFGTGLNAFLTLINILGTGKKVQYTGIELYPIEESLLRSLNYSSQYPEDKGRYFEKIHRCPWNTKSKITNNFSIEKIQEDIANLNVRDQYDLVYFDAFSPEVQSNLWTTEIFHKIFTSMRTGGILTTYSSKGQVRRNLKEVGFQVEKLPGPPGKRDITRAWKF
jgi:tRNA U34 5-methylaminomethyl-2-thiouridine-forming methyltransferase MnmC